MARPRQPACTRVFQIGRTSDNDLIIDHDTISRKHAELTVSNNHLRIKDLHSSSGTRLNGKTCPFEKKVFAGDNILLGLVNLTIDTSENKKDIEEEKTRAFQPDELNSVLRELDMEQPAKKDNNKAIIISLCLLIMALSLYIWMGQ